MQIKIEAQQFSQQIKKETWLLFSGYFAKKFKRQLNPKDFIILSSIGIIKKGQNNIKLIALGSGTKTLPNSVITTENKDDLLRDMHAQMLAIRGFRRFLLQQLQKQTSQYLQWREDKQKYTFSKKYEIFLYCSQIFCGDCCINASKQTFSGAKPLSYLCSSEYSDDKYTENILRTKPGRSDIPMPKRSSILSCSDLIGFFNIMGIQGKKIFSKIMPIYIDKIILDGSLDMQKSIEKGINLQERLSILKGIKQANIYQKILKLSVDGKIRKISNQFKIHSPKVCILEKNESRDKQGFQLCGIFSQDQQEWINGKTGLPQGSSLKNYSQKGKISKFCQTQLLKDFPIYKEGVQAFKYEAISNKIKLLFGEWIDDSGE